MRILWVFLLMLSLSSCQKKSPEYFQDEGRRKMQELVEVLQKIECLEEMHEAFIHLQSIYTSMAELMIQARRYQIKKKVSWDLSKEDHILSRELQHELQRIYQMEGAQEFMEKCQMRALLLVDAFEKKCAQSSIYPNKLSK